EVALIDVVIAERDVGVDEREAAGAVEDGRFWRERDEPQAVGGSARVVEARFEVAARIGRARVGGTGGSRLWGGGGSRRACAGTAARERERCSEQRANFQHRESSVGD